VPWQAFLNIAVNPGTEQPANFSGTNTPFNKNLYLRPYNKGFCFLSS